MKDGAMVTFIDVVLCDVVDKIPAVALTCNVSGSTNVAPFACTATWDEDVVGFDLSDIVVANGILAGCIICDELKTIGTLKHFFLVIG
jgi:hypothetical protein